MTSQEERTDRLTWEGAVYAGVGRRGGCRRCADCGRRSAKWRCRRGRWRRDRRPWCSSRSSGRRAARVSDLWRRPTTEAHVKTIRGKKMVFWKQLRRLAEKNNSFNNFIEAIRLKINYSLALTSNSLNIRYFTKPSPECITV